MRLYLGTHEPRWLGRSDRPLFISLVRSDRFNQKAARAGWALDSGGYTQLHHGGWTEPPERYLERVYALDDRCAGMEWASPQDWMNEPSARAATGLTVADHQRLTTENYLALRAIDSRQLVVPVLQGWEPGDHERHAEQYAAAGVDLRDCALVGVGSICRRQDSAEIEGIVRALAGGGLRLHGFGVKAGGLRRYAPYLVSADSMAWSFRARKHALHGGAALCGGQHRACNNCFAWAHTWHGNLTNIVTTGVDIATPVV